MILNVLFGLLNILLVNRACTAGGTEPKAKFRYRLSTPAVGVDDGEGPPVPIPNTEVKLTCADNTWLETAREDR